MADLTFQDWGLIDYDVALKKQLELVEKVHSENLPGYLVFCSHPPVVTLGRATKEGDVFAWNGRVVEVSRGGRATYHGPSQLIVYPILNLTFARKGRKDREIVGYLRALEDAIVDVLKSYDVQAQGKSLHKNPQTDSEADETGVWVGNHKIASLGVGVRKWVTFHGAAINLNYDPKAFVGMNPCGFTTETMVSLEQVLQSPVDLKQFSEKLKMRLIQVL
ncbi:lipoyl(octanoyl) transferase LipB [Bdellovibrio sp. HCB-162]|uniref:lipoyl(octanoyl) transferase LipB n=1 Tax=Bdellovibrio sp. HCB-162 TaxID=3394234 RepID=UPI0039BD5F83